MTTPEQKPHPLITWCEKEKVTIHEFKGREELHRDSPKWIWVIAGSCKVTLHLVDETGAERQEMDWLELSSGQLLYLCPDGEKDIAWKWSSNSGMKYLEFSPKEFHKHSQDKDFGKTIRDGLLWWLELMGLHLPEPQGSQKSAKLTIRHGKDLEVNADQWVQTADQIMFLKHEYINAFGIDNEGNRLPKPECDYWPMTRKKSAHCTSETKLTPISVDNYLLAESKLQSLIVYDRAIKDIAFKKIREEWQESLEREKTRIQKRKLELQEEHERLIRLLDPKRPLKPHTDDLLLRAAYAMIQKHGWSPVLPKNLDTEDPEKFLMNMARTSNLNMRHAKLSGQWWKGDIGTFLGFDKDHKPYLFYRTWLGYRVWDPDTQKSFAFTPSFGEQLGSQAVYYYKTMESTALTIKSLVMFSMESVKNEVVTLLFLALVGSGLTALIPIVTSFVINRVIPGADIPLLWIFCYATLMVGVMRVSFQWINEIMMSRMNNKLDLLSTAALWDRILHFPIRSLANYSSGDLMMRMDSLLGLQNFSRIFLQMTVFHTIQLIFSFCIMFWVSIGVGLVALGMGTLSILMSLFFAALQVKVFKGGEKSAGIVNAYVLEIFSGIHKIKAAAAELSCFMQWANRYGKLKAKLIGTRRVANAFDAWESFWTIATMAGVYYMISLLKEEQIELGGFMAFLGAFGTSTASLSVISSMLMAGGMQIPMLKFIEPLMKNRPETQSEGASPRKLEGKIRIEQLMYGYPNAPQPALAGVNLDIEAGSFVAIVGMSGCGKSTLVKMISGLERPQRGRVYLDDYELPLLDSKVRNNNLSTVMQSYKLLPGSLFENIRGASDATLDEVWEAAEMASIADEIKELPMGLHTMVTGSTHVFSGGQIQRMAIARALVRKPKVIIFDEATSALDNRTQGKIMERLNAWKMTRIVVAHRLNTVRNADMIVVMDKGQVVEKGTWDELIQNQGLFSKMTQSFQKEPANA